MVMQFWKIISLFHYGHLETLIAIFLPLDFTLAMTRSIVKPTIWQKYGSSKPVKFVKRAKKTGFWIFETHKR